jgi:NADP-dependent 3-hydroxy acid dehydrogenase YdfG
VKEELGGADVLVNDAGVMLLGGSPLNEILIRPTDQAL